MDLKNYQILSRDEQRKIIGGKYGDDKLCVNTCESNSGCPPLLPECGSWDCSLDGTTVSVKACYPSR
jgi:hypothetical protein